MDVEVTVVAPGVGEIVCPECGGKRADRVRQGQISHPVGR